MAKGLSQGQLEGLKPKDRPYELRDTKVPGLLVRVQPSGVVSFIVQLGRARRVTLGRFPICTLQRARELAHNALSATFQGASTAAIHDIVKPKRESAPVTLRSFLKDRYTQWLELHLKTGKAESARLLSSFKSIADKPLAQVDAWALQKWRGERLAAGRKATSINRDVAAFRAALRRAVEWKDVDSDPLGKVTALKADSRGVVRFLSQVEESALRAALDSRAEFKATSRASGNAWRERRKRPLLPAEVGDPLRTMVILSLNTGLRRGELFALTWGRVDFARRVLTVQGETAKGGLTRHIPLSGEAVEELGRWRRAEPSPETLVFPGKDGDRYQSLKKSWAAVLKAAGIEQFRWHDLRHTFASNLVQAGVDLNTVRELMGHADIKMTLRYAHLSPSHLADAISKLRPPPDNVSGGGE